MTCLDPWTTRPRPGSVPVLAVLILALSSLALPGLPLLAAPPAGAGGPAADSDAAASPARAAFERLKALEGTWTGTGMGGSDVVIEYEVVGGGSALVEHFRMPEMPDHTMVTVYHLDGDEMVLTHYCGAGNQPTMRARGDGISPEELRFELTGVTNLASPDAGHMRRAVLDLGDVRGESSDRYTTAWTWRAGEEEAEVHRIEARRDTAAVAPASDGDSGLRKVVLNDGRDGE